MQRVEVSRAASVWVVVACAAVLAACQQTAGAGASPSGAAKQGRPASERLDLVNQWASLILELGKVPVLPPSEDVYVGDVYLFPAVPAFSSSGSFEGLRTQITPRWASLDVSAAIDAEYRHRPTWLSTTELRDQLATAGSEPADTEPAESIHVGEHTPTRHRLVALRAMSKLTFKGSDLGPLLPLEVAPMIDGVSSMVEGGVSIQAGEAESYSLSLDTLLGELLEPVDGPEGPTHRLKDEHRTHVALMAEPGASKAYMAVISEVLYFRSLDLTVHIDRGASGAAGAAPAAGATPVADPAASAAPVADPAADGVAGADPAAGGAPVADPAAGGAPVADPAAGAVPVAEVAQKKSGDRLREASDRALEMNTILADSDARRTLGDDVKFIMVTDTSVTLRRTWQYPLAVAVRGVNLEVDVSTGTVSRVGAFGMNLPKPPPPPPQPAAPAE